MLPASRLLLLCS